MAGRRHVRAVGERACVHVASIESVIVIISLNDETMMSCTAPTGPLYGRVYPPRPVGHFLALQSRIQCSHSIDTVS